MVRKKVDARVRTLIENGVKANHRSTFVLVGDYGKDQVTHDQAIGVRAGAASVLHLYVVSCMVDVRRTIDMKFDMSCRTTQEARASSS